ncbi:MAG: hypothetical protein LLF89_08345 [Spirochaetaceae bacterium]|nr:hypothetical protein [Spirochaetaceae bacterium]
MRPSEKTRSDILRSLGGKNAAPGHCVDDNFSSLPESAKGLLRELFSRKYQADPGAATEWLATLGTIFAQDYDGTPLREAEWRELPGIISAGAGEMDMELVSYVMGLVMEHKAL